MENKHLYLRAISSLIAVTSVSACYEGGAQLSAAELSPMEGQEPDHGSEFITELRGIDDDFAAAADEFDVPEQVLKAIGYVETQWQMVEGEAEFDGQEAAFGVMALRGAHIESGAAILGVSVDEVKYDRPTNIRAAAALLSTFADEQEIDRDDTGAWALAVASMTDIPVEEALSSYIHREVYGVIRNGIAIADEEGELVAHLRPDASVAPNFSLPTAPLMAAGPDYDGAIWRPSPNFSSRNGVGVRMVVIHSCEGGYGGCWSWLTNSQAGASAHYVVKEDGSEISQLVRESDMAWHVAAAYNCNLNGGKECDLQGYGSNLFSVGIEHAGFASQASWNKNLIDQSAKLTCEITKQHDIPRDKFHIVSHGQLQPYDRTDPGSNWPWTTYLNKVNEHCGAPRPQSTGGSAGAIVIDSNPGNNDPETTRVVVSGNWAASAATPGYYGSGYWFAHTAPVADGAEFWFHLPAAATKTVEAWWTAGSNRSTSAPFVILDSSEKKLATVHVNQQVDGGRFVNLGTFNFKAGWNKVVLSRWTTEGAVVMADAIRIR